MHESGARAAADAVDWAAVKALYEAGEVPVSRLCEDHGITPWQLRSRYLREGWKVRPQAARRGAPGQTRSPVEIAVGAVLRFVAVQARRLAAAPGPVPQEHILTLTGLAKAAEGLMREDRMSRLGVQEGAGRKSSVKQAVGGGFNTEEEAIAADEAFMRAELKRRTDVLAAALRRGEISLDRLDDGGTPSGEA